MTEKEKMRTGALYNALFDRELVALRAACKERCQRYNRLPFLDFAARFAAIREILGSCGETLLVEPPFWCDYGHTVFVGENFAMNHSCVLLDAGTITFGDNVLVGPQCGFYTAGHPLDAASRNQGLEFARPILVGSNVWIGGGVTVLPGVTIGDDTVIGAGSVVTKDIPAGTLAAGNPCRVLRALP